MEKTKMRQAYNSAFDGVENEVNFLDLNDSTDGCLKFVQNRLVKNVCDAKDPHAPTFDTYVGLTLIDIRFYFKKVLEQLGFSDFKGVLNAMVNVDVHQSHFDFVIDTKTKFSQAIMNAITVGGPFLLLNQRLVINDLSKAWKEHEELGERGSANVHEVMSICTTSILKVVHRIAALYDHTVEEVVPSFVDLVLMYAAFYLAGVCLPAFSKVLPNKLAVLLYSDVQKLTSIFHRVRGSHLNDLFKNGSDKL